MPARTATGLRDRRVIALRTVCLLAWAAVSFGACYFARDMHFLVGPWPFAYWMAGQGALVAFILILVAYAWAMNRLAPEDAVQSQEPDG